MQPKEVQNFVKMLSVFFDEDNRKSIIDELVEKADRADDALTALTVREAALQERERQVQNESDHAKATAAQAAIDASENARVTHMNEQERIRLAQVDAAQASKDVDQKNMLQTISSRSQLLKLQSEDLDARDAQIATMQKELDAKTATVDAQMAKIAAIQEQ